MKKNKVIMIGPFPNPIHGMSLANQLIKDEIKISKLADLQIFNTNLESSIKSKNRQGKIEIGYLIRSVISTLSCIYFIARNPGSIAYFTPGQSALGLIRYFPQVFLSIILNKKTILHIHGSRLAINIKNSQWILRKLIIWMLKKSSAVIALSPRILNDFASTLNLSNLVVCMNGVSIPEITQEDIHKKFSRSKLKLLFLSNLMLEKGILELIISTSKLYESGVDLHLDIAGSLEPASKDIVLRYIESNSHYITYHGTVYGEEKDKLYRECSIFCLPSYDEGIPLSILEAYSYGCVVITTDVGGLPDIFHDKLNGFLCQPRDQDSLYKALQIASSAYANLAEIGKRNSIIAKKTYSFEIFKNSILKILF